MALTSEEQKEVGDLKCDPLVKLANATIGKVVKLMRSKWKITWQRVGNTDIYQVYRIRNINAIDHAGNREYFPGTFDNEAAAQAVADRLNES